MVRVPAGIPPGTNLEPAESLLCSRVPVTLKGKSGLTAAFVGKKTRQGCASLRPVTLFALLRPTFVQLPVWLGHSVQWLLYDRHPFAVHVRPPPAVLPRPSYLILPSASLPARHRSKARLAVASPHLPIACPYASLRGFALGCVRLPPQQPGQEWRWGRMRSD